MGADMYTKDLVDDIKEIQKVMGVCPQHDLLWGSLTGQEHLLFYGRLRGLKGAKLDRAVRVGLADVSLTFAAKKAAKAYSGGMKRRLSVACCLIGKPKIVYLDEPSTGLDPASRRKLWDVIRRASKDCAMILTTHSMEEADALCDRITIMAAGKLRCIGTGIELKQTYSEGYKFSVSCAPDAVASADNFVRTQVFAGSKPEQIKQLNTLAGTTNYTVSNDLVRSTTLSKVFKTMETAKKDHKGANIGDWGISEGTLEEVFASITDNVVQSGNTKTEAELRAEKAAQNSGPREFAGAPGFSSWFAAMPVHTGWLMWKNLTIYKRNRNSTGIIILSGVIIMCMLRLLQEMQGQGGGGQMFTGPEKNPPVYDVLPIQKCQPLKWSDCRSAIIYRPYTHQYRAGPQMDVQVDGIVENIIKNNGLPGLGEKQGVEVRRYDASETKYMAGIKEWLANNQNYTKLGIIIPEGFGSKIGPETAGTAAYTAAMTNATRDFGFLNLLDGSCRQPTATTFECRENYKFEILYNWTATCTTFRLLGCDSPRDSLVWPAYTHVQNAIYQQFSNKPDAKWTPTWTTFPHGDLTWRFQQSIVNAYVPRFGMAAIVFMFVVQLGLVVREKEQKLREALKMIGGKDAAYWLAWLIVNALMVLVGTALMIGVSVLIELKPLVVSDFRVSFLLFLVFAVSMIGMSFVVSALIARAQTATLLGFGLFIVAYLFTDLVEAIYDSTATSNVPWQHVLKFVSPIMFLRACASMCRDEVVSGSGIQWDCQGKFGCTDIYNDKELYPIIDCLMWMIYDTFIYLFLGWYIDKVLPTEYGSAEPLYFIFNPFWWMGTGVSEKPVAPYVEDEEKLGLDGKAEEKDVEEMCKATLKNEYNPDDVFVEVKRLKKIFGGNMGVGCFMPQKSACDSEDAAALLCCCCCHSICGIPYPRRNPKFHAVRGVSYTIPNDELFCLLGPNGAGKTTTINMMTGLHPQTSGQIKVDGMSVQTQMKDVRKIMGCCPQHDILWTELTASEHVKLFARMKGVATKDLNQEVISRLEAVDLADVKDKVAGAYSGGMLRRLSVTLSLTGEPKIAYMDEPTTGMDPVSRRHVWDLIEQCKKGRTILLTTHSMEEADVLGNTIAIMGKGRLRAFGTSLHLKNILALGISSRSPARRTARRRCVTSSRPLTPTWSCWTSSSAPSSSATPWWTRKGKLQVLNSTCSVPSWSSSSLTSRLSR